MHVGVRRQRGIAFVVQICAEVYQKSRQGIRKKYDTNLQETVENDWERKSHGITNTDLMISLFDEEIIHKKQTGMFRYVSSLNSCI
mmetsp:Transcript_23346/g.49318  ORF Transcript_23346/g.49318 Transcript_23346/m.49318 type:complete len:86 (+) Transcript_23346:590-847(+)